MSRKILILGASGMLGSALARRLKDFDPLLPSKAELDLLDRHSTENYFKRNAPSFVYMCAARVGGIEANIAKPYSFLVENMEMQANFFYAIENFNVEKALLVGSSCVYPKSCQQPMMEADLFTGALEPTNEAYAAAKLIGITQAKYLYKERGVTTVCPIVTNIYGTNDYYDESRSHVIAALIHRFERARLNGDHSVACWGTGTAKREFIFVDDAAEILVKLMENYDSVEPVNVGTGNDVSLRDLAQLVKDITGFSGTIVWDTERPEGMQRKLLDITKITKLGYRAQTSLEFGIQHTLADYRKRNSNGVIR